jgi:hypothetical protein
LESLFFLLDLFLFGCLLKKKKKIEKSNFSEVVKEESLEETQPHIPFSQEVEELKQIKSGFYIIEHPIARPARKNEYIEKRVIKKVISKEYSDAPNWQNSESKYDTRLEDLDKEIEKLNN